MFPAWRYHPQQDGPIACPDRIDAVMSFGVRDEVSNIDCYYFVPSTKISLRISRDRLTCSDVLIWELKTYLITPEASTT